MKPRVKPITIHKPAYPLPQFEKLEAQVKKPWLEQHEIVPRDRLYHYTTAEGLQGILASQKLWFTDAEYMNDASELSYGHELIVSQIREVEESSQGIVNRFLRATRANLNTFKVKGLTPYVACFCEDGDLLSPWRSYANRGGGYALGIRIDPDVRWTLNKKIPKLRKVIYDPPLQNELVREAISRFVKAQRTLDVASLAKRYHGSDRQADLAAVNTPAIHLSNVLVEYILSFKDHTFREEREWRMIYVVSSIRQKKYLRFRTADGYVVPYVEIELFDAKGFFPWLKLLSVLRSISRLLNRRFRYC